MEVFMQTEVMDGQRKVSTAKKLVILAVVMAACVGLTFSGGLLALIEITWLKRLLNCAVYALLSVPAIIGIKLSGMSIKKQLDFANAKQYLWALAVFAFLSLTVAVLPALFGTSLIGQHSDFPPLDIAYYALFYIVFVGPVEELIFRGYVQELFVEILPKNKWLGAVIAAAVFGLWHLVNGSIFQVLFAFLIGSVFGLTKYFFKNCTLISEALGHGLYDFMNIIIRIVLIK